MKKIPIMKKLTKYMEKINQCNDNKRLKLNNQLTCSQST